MKEYETPSVETYGTVEEKTNWWTTTTDTGSGVTSTAGSHI